MSGADIGLSLGILASILVAGILALSETALTRVSRFKVIQMVEEERRGAVRLQKLLDDPPRFLNVILFLLLVVQLGGASMATVLADHISHSYGTVISTFGMTLLIFIFAEAAPKTYAIQHAEAVAIRVAPVISWLIRIPGLQALLNVLVVVANVVTPGKGFKRGPFVTEGELRTMASVAAEEASIEEEEKEMIHSIFEFGDTVVREVMQPRPDMVAVAVGAMVLAFVALVALANGLLGGLGNLAGIPDLSFQRIIGYVFQPVMFLIGVPWKEAGTAGGLFGTKLVLNEFVAFIDLGKMDAATLSQRSRVGRCRLRRAGSNPAAETARQ